MAYFRGQTLFTEKTELDDAKDFCRKVMKKSFSAATRMLLKQEMRRTGHSAFIAKVQISEIKTVPKVRKPRVSA